jgi:soluble lytic murein transglycosylase-like protein
MIHRPQSVPYAHRGARSLHRARRRAVKVMAAAVVAALVLAREATRPAPAAEAAVAASAAPLGVVRHAGAFAAAPPRAEVERWNRVHHFARRYAIHADLARAIHDAALAEGIEPELGFRLVRVESEFKVRATSPVGAVGLTQVMPATARQVVPGVTRRQLYDRDVNLKVGFRYLRGLLREYRSVRIALLVYNRGPVAVEGALARGEDPANGYELAVAKGYRGRGLVSR